MNKPLKINLTNYCLSHLQAAALGTQSKRADAEKGGERREENDNFMFG